MRKIIVEAFEDESRPQGGHAVILLHGLDNVPQSTTFRLRPVDAGQHTELRSLWRNNALSPITTRVTDRGVEFVVGPDIVGNPMLLSGTPVVIELPDAGVRGEFLWPSVAPLAPPRRRHLVGRGVPAVRRSKPSWSHRICRSRSPPSSSAHTETVAAECIRLRRASNGFHADLSRNRNLSRPPSSYRCSVRRP